MQGQREIKSLRKPREKHFLNKDGTFTAHLYDQDIHYLKDGKYYEIDNNLIERNNTFTNKSNIFKVSFEKDKNNNKIFELIKGKHLLTLELKDNKNTKTDIIHKLNIINYKNILNNIDIKYETLSDKLKEEIILKSKDNIPDKLIFVIKTNLNLEINKDKTINVMNRNEILYTIDAPFMYDANNNYNDNIDYSLEKQEDSYLLTLNLDKKWLEKKATIFPVTIDPTITVNNKNNIYDAYIDNTNPNKISNTDVLKVGVDKTNNKDTIYRSLIKFDLPTIGTGGSVVDASLTLFSHTSDYETGLLDEESIIDFHVINKAWNESNATWSNIADAYDKNIENITTLKRSTYKKDSKGNITITSLPNTINITNIVRKWYSGTPNYGIMLKSHNENYNQNKKPFNLFSKDHKITNGNPTPIITITYLNKNGLEDYMSYESQDFTDGTCYINHFNGNLITDFSLNETLNGKFPASLDLIYSTNDVILNNNYGYGLGYKLSLHQLIKEITSDSKNYLEYLDRDGTLHYFYIKDNEYIDQDGLGLTAYKENDNYIIKDKDSNKMLFEKNDTVWYLKEIIDTSNNKVIITYNENNKIIKITDADNEKINLNYEEGKTIITTSHETTTLNYLNNQVKSLITKNGITTFDYNQNNILEKITDTNTRSIGYTYYDTIPYKVKQVKEYSTDLTEGKSLEFKYEFDITHVIDNKNRYTTYTFNENANVIGITNLNNENSIKDGYCKAQNYVSNKEKANNKLETDNVLIKPVTNYISNSSFETDSSNGYSEDITLLRTTEFARTGSYSLKLKSDEVLKKLSYFKVLPKDGYYTFSTFIKNDSNLKLAIRYLDKEGYDGYDEKTIYKHDDFSRVSLSTSVPIQGNYDVEIIFTQLEEGTIYLDDLQLEEGRVANSHNLIENSDFSDDIAYWTLEVFHHNEVEETEIDYEIITLDNDDTAIKLKSDPYKSFNLREETNIKGNKNDVFNLSFWYKNPGIKSELFGKSINAYIKFTPTDDTKEAIIEEFPLSFNNNTWQYFSKTFTAKEDYKNIEIHIENNRNVNGLYITKVSLFKDVENNSYTYDEEGNLTSIKNLDKTKDDFNYDKNNQLIAMFNPSGSNFKFEYDNNITDRVLTGLSSNGIANKIKYDEHGNPIKTIIQNIYFDKENPNSIYYIKSKGTNKYFKVKAPSNTISIEESNCSIDKFKIQKENEYYRISSILKSNHYLTNVNANLVLTKLTDDNTLFELIEQKNGSYKIKTKNQNYYLCNENDKLVLKEIKEETNNEKTSEQTDYNLQFYIEDATNNLFIEESSEYTPNGKVITKTIDALGNITNYEVDEVKNQIKSITDANGNKTEYTYNNKDQITKITKNKKTAEYEYNNQDLLSKIKLDNKEYSFEYDNFLNIKTIKVGNQALINNEYEEKNGNLVLSTYGNQDKIEYFYDELDRINKTITMDNTYLYYYNNFGDLAKIIDNHNIYEYIYDFAQRLSNYKFNNFEIDYNYDSNNNINKKTYILENNNQIMNYAHDKDDSITNINFNNNNINYIYDNLGRLKEKNIDGSNKVTYEYQSNGNKTSLNIKKITINNDKYEYNYDKLNNITEIYINNELINKYEYDNQNQLIKEKNYKTNKLIEYNYDTEGNIKKMQEYNLKENTLIKTDNYEYSNQNWKDQLTKYNNETIIYDEIGNPTNIGQNIKMTWTNGRTLKSYEDTSKNLVINYTYDIDGIRTSKAVNNEKTEYYTENNHIIFEKTSNHMLYYIRDDEGNLEGFKYNDIVYYYEKNLADDIIGILNQNKEKIATYEYDSWGNILSIKDENENEITDSNHIAIINPFRYRSYYYDTETNLYYLNSRYYNPRIKRFINADGYVSTGQDINGYNMYAYCNNNSLNCIDLSGDLFLRLGLAILKSKITKKVVKAVKSIGKALKNNFVFEIGRGNGIYYSNSFIIAPGSKSKKTQNKANKKFPKKILNSASDISLIYDSSVIYEGYKGGKSYIRSETTSSISIGPVGYGETAGKDITDPIKSQLTDFQPNRGFNVTSGDNFIAMINDSAIFIGYEFGVIIGSGGVIRIGWEIDYK